LFVKPSLPQASEPLPLCATVLPNPLHRVIGQSPPGHDLARFTMSASGLVSDRVARYWLEHWQFRMLVVLAGLLELEGQPEHTVLDELVQAALLY